MTASFKKNPSFFYVSLLILSLAFIPLHADEQRDNFHQHILDGMHSISSHLLYDYVYELCSGQYAGRLTGTQGYNLAANWVCGLLKKMGITPAASDKSYLQAFANPYTLVLEQAALSLIIPLNETDEIQKHYLFETDFYPGSTSDSGELTAEVIYVGYGISSPELEFDEYQHVDVSGKIVLMEREVPVSPEKNPQEFIRWRPYSFHQYKVQNARAHGAAGMLYHYHIVNPNCLFIQNLVLSYIGSSVVQDIFSGTGKAHQQVVNQIKNTLKPQSFATNKVFSMKNRTEHHAEGIAYNIIGIIEGKDPMLKKESIIIGAHLDHVGQNHLLMPGANDNASGVSVVLGVAEAIAKLPFRLKRSIIFILFGAEEQGVLGSEYFLNHPIIPKNQMVAFINLDGVGRGNKIEALAAKNYPHIWKFFSMANERYIHRKIDAEYFQNLARPRLDAARFMWAGIPTISFSTYGAPELPFEIYHSTLDSPDIITPEIMEDLAQLIFVSLVEMAGY